MEISSLKAPVVLDSWQIYRINENCRMRSLMKMRIGFRAWILIGVAFAAGLTVYRVSSKAQAPAAQPYRAPRTADGKPNLNGIWQALNEANWDLEPHAAAQGTVLALGAQFSIAPGIGVVEGGSIPYKPEAL